MKKVVKRKLYGQYFFLVPLLFFVLFWCFFILYREYLIHQTKSQTAITTPYGIDTLIKIPIGGYNQWVLIRGENRQNPILLYLHGSPGACLFPYARQIGKMTEIEKYFVVAYWEQRGTGKSYHPNIPDSSMTIEQLISDTHDISQFLIRHFNQKRIFLMARSWGSLIGMLTIQKYPHLFYAYISIGQMVAPLENDQLSFEQTVRLAMSFQNHKALKELNKVGPPPYDYRNLLIQRKWLTEFYSKIMNEKNSAKITGYYTLLRYLLATPEYSVSDLIRIGFDPYFALRQLWNKNFYQYNLFELVKRVEIPVYFFAGKYDYFTFSELVQKFYDQLEAPNGKYFFWFKNSGHHPEFEEPEKFRNIIRDEIVRQFSGEQIY